MNLLGPMDEYRLQIMEVQSQKLDDSGGGKTPFPDGSDQTKHLLHLTPVSKLVVV